MSEEEVEAENFIRKFNQPKHSYICTEKYTSDFYKDLTLEKNLIQQAFQSNNYTYIRKLPLNLKPNTILDQRFKRVGHQVQQEKQGRDKTFQQKYQLHQQAVKNKKMEQIGSMGYFQAFTYEGEEYDIARELAQRKRQSDEETRKKISDLDFRPSDVEYKGKYQDPFEYRDKANPKIKDTSNYLFPFHIPSDTYDSFHQSQVRKQLNEKAENLAATFLPSMNDKSLSKVHRSMLKQILEDIESFIKKHLKKYPCILAVTVKDHIELLFSEEYKQDLKLKTVMSMVCQNGSLQKYYLKREVNRWGVVDHQYICFTIIPPWVSYSGKGCESWGSTAQITKTLNELERQSAFKKE